MIIDLSIANDNELNGNKNFCKKICLYNEDSKKKWNLKQIQIQTLTSRTKT